MKFLVVLCNVAAFISALAWGLVFFSPFVHEQLDWNFFCTLGVRCFLYPLIVLAGIACSFVSWRLGYKLAAGLIPLFPPAGMIFFLQYVLG